MSPKITLGNNVANVNDQYCGGMIGRVRENTKNERSIEISNVTMTNAEIQFRSKYSGGLLGTMWDRTQVTINGLTVTGSKVENKYSSDNNKLSGLVFRATGKWDVNSLSVSNTQFSTDGSKPESFGLIVNEGYRDNDGLYLNLKNSGYTLTNVTVPTSSNTNYFVDEIVADTKNNSKDSGDILVSGNGVGIININMNTAGGTNTKVSDTGTYQNRITSLLNDNLIANQNSRYYYNLDVMSADDHTKTGGENFLLWSVNQYAAGNIKKYFSGSKDVTDINLSGLSYYPISISDVNLPNNAVITLDYSGINAKEDTTSPDGWDRDPLHNGKPKTTEARNQHYLMQTGLFHNVGSFTANALTIQGDFGYVDGDASGALINGQITGTLTLAGLTLNGLAPSNADSALIVNHVNGEGTNISKITLSNVRANGYSETNTQAVAASLFGSAKGQNLTMSFSDIKLDARDGDTITDSKWTSSAAAAAMNTAYGTSRSIFSNAIFFNSLLSTAKCDMVYNYTVEEDWGESGATTFPRNVTYGKEIIDSKQYVGGEQHYNIVGDGTSRFTNPVSNSDSPFDFKAGFLPYVANYEAKGQNNEFPITEIKVNYKEPGITVGCGTYNDPYVISTPAQLETVAGIINGTKNPDNLRLPNVFYADHVSTSWHTEESGDGIYNLSGSNYNKATNNPNGVDNKWNKTTVRKYFASAYFQITNDIELTSAFEGIGTPNDTSGYKGNYVFHGVIVGKGNTAPKITNPTDKPFIVVSNGSVIKNLQIENTGSITRTQTETGGSALYGYNGDDTDAKYYGGVIGEIMGGDNIIDDVTVTYTGSTTLSGGYAHVIAEGGMVGAVVNGALIFRGSNSVSGRNVTGGGIYSNPIVGRVINGYAIYEQISGKTGTAPDNTNADNNVYYHIDTIVRKDTDKLDVNYSAGTINVPDAQALYVMSLITQSIAGTADTSGNMDYSANSPSYGATKDGIDVLTGVARLGDYTSVGCGIDSAKPVDYSEYAYRDSVNNYYNSKLDLVWSPTPYIIYRYTKAYGTDNWTSKNFPARNMTSDTISNDGTKATSSNAKFFTITLAPNGDFTNFERFAAFRGIGSAFVRSTKTSIKVKQFNGNDQTLKLNIKMHRYIRDKENVQYGWATELKQVPNITGMNSNTYGLDTQPSMLIGLGLFDMTLTESQDTYFKNLTIGGCVEDHCYEIDGTDARVKHSTDNSNNTNLYGVGGIVGHGFRYYNQNFDNIRLDGLNVESAYAAGGLLGFVSYKQNDTDSSEKRMTVNIKNCQAVGGGVTVTGGSFERQNDGKSYRHGAGAFVGMTVGSKISMNGNETGELDENGKVKQAEIKINKITTFNTSNGNVSCCIGGLVGYTGAGAEISNIKLSSANDSSFIGSDITNNKTATVAAAFVAFAQKDNANNGDIIVTNCDVENLNIYATKSAGAVFGKSWDGDKSWCPTAMQITDCAIISTKGSKIMSTGVGDKISNVAGGLTGSLAMSQNTKQTFIDNCYVKGYTIQGYVVGGLFGSAFGNSNNNIIVKNSYAQDCIMISNEQNGTAQPGGGLFGYSDGKNIDAYNLAIYNVEFKTSSNADNTNNSGALLGANSSSLVDKFVGIGAYHDDPSKVPSSVVKTNGTNANNFFVYADYLNASSADITNKSGNKSTFNAENNVDQPKAPYVNVNPRIAVGTDEFITSDGAGAGVAGAIYAEAIKETDRSNRAYTKWTDITDPHSGNKKDKEILSKYINTN